MNEEAFMIYPIFFEVCSAFDIILFLDSFFPSSVLALRALKGFLGFLAGGRANILKSVFFFGSFNFFF